MRCEPLNTQFFATLANIRCEHLDRFTIPFDIYEVVAIQWVICHFDYRAGRNCHGTLLPILVEDSQRRCIQTVTLATYRHSALLNLAYKC